MKIKCTKDTLVKLNNQKTKKLSSEKDKNKRTIIIECPMCKKEQEVTIEKRQLKFLKEYNQYENITLPPCECGCVHVLNMNLPDDEYDISDLIEGEEWYKRHIIKNIKKMLLGEKDYIEDVVPIKKKFKGVEK